LGDGLSLPVTVRRPSRRGEIIEAVIRVLAETTLARMTVEQVAAEASIGVTALYYHFAGKEELFDEAFKVCMQRVSQAIVDERSRTDSLNAEALHEVIHASWAWWRTHPLESRVLLLHAGGATSGSRRAWSEWQEFHAVRAFDYLAPADRPSPTSRNGKEMYATRLLGFHFLNAMLVGTQHAWLGGPLRSLPASELAEVLADTLVPMLLGKVDPLSRASRK
jgi:AcrR family transcriptional regulator